MPRFAGHDSIKQRIIINKNFMKKAAVILCGIGNQDGSEVYETTSALIALDQNNIEYQCFAIDKELAFTNNYLTQEKMPETRNQLVEAGRLSRGQAQNINNCKADDFDYLIIPGGFGVAHNLCSFATEGINATVQQPVQQLILDFHSAKKNIGAICIAPVLLALTLGKTHKPMITAGDGSATDIINAYNSLGAEVKNLSSTEYIHDTNNNLFSTPAYMNNASISQIFSGINSMITAMVN